MWRSQGSVVREDLRNAAAQLVTRLLATLVLTLALPSLASAQVGGIAPSRDTEGGPTGARNIEGKTAWQLPVLWDQTVTVNSGRNQLTRDPSYIWWFTFRPRLVFQKNLSLGSQFFFNYEWTNTPEADFNRPGFYGGEVFWGDVRIDLAYTLPVRPWDMHFELVFNLRLPSSKFSRSRERILSPGIALDMSKRFDVLRGWALNLHTEYWGWIANSNVAVLDFNDYPCRIAPGGGGFLDNCFGENTAAKQFIALAGSTVLEPLDRFKIGTGFAIIWGQAFDVATATIDTLTGPVVLGDDSGNARWRTFANFSFFLSYGFTEYLRGIVAYDTWSAQPDSDGGRENYFYNENTRLVFSFEFLVERLYSSVSKARAARKAAKTLAELE